MKRVLAEIEEDKAEARAKGRRPSAGAEAR
jgi:hypothetical protein